MNEFEAWSLVVAALGVLVNLVLFVVFFLQLSTLRKQVGIAEQSEIAEDSRVRRQATVEFYANTHDRRQRFLLWARKNDLLNASQICDRAKGNELVRQHLVDYLNYYEFLAVGILTGTYDGEIARRLAGRRIVCIFQDYNPYIQWVRSELQAPKLYIELENLATSIAASRRSEGIPIPSAPGEQMPVIA